MTTPSAVRGRVPGASLAAGLLTAAYAGLFMRFGIFDVADEGLLLTQAYRVAAGQRPYLDFHTGYGPLYFDLTGWLMRTGGVAAIRAALVGVHAIGAALLVEFVQRRLGSRLAWVALALLVAFFMPVAPGRGTPLTVPYPSWLAGPAFLATALLLESERPHLLAIGLIAGALAAVKLNSGVLLGAGAGAAIVLSGEPVAAWLRAGTSLVIVALALAVVGDAWSSATALSLAGPMVGLALLRPAARLSVGGGGRLATLVGAAAMVVAVTLGPLLVTLGPARFAHDVLLLGANVAAVYATPLPWPAVLASGVGVLAFCGAGSSRWTRAFFVAGGVTLAIATLVGAESASAGLATRARLGAESAVLAAAALCAWGALALARRHAEPSATSLAALTAAAVLQLYPRADLPHVMPIAGVVIAAGLVVWERGVRALVTAAGLQRALIIDAPLLLAGARLVPTVVLMARMAAGEMAEIQAGSLRLVIDPPGAPRLEALARVVEEVRARSTPDQQVLGFPACTLASTLAGRLPAGPHDYFFPGRPAAEEVGTLVRRFEAAPPSLAVTCSTEGSDLSKAWRDDAEMVEFLRRRYRPRLELPPFFTVLEARP